MFHDKADQKPSQDRTELEEYLAGLDGDREKAETLAALEQVYRRIYWETMQRGMSEVRPQDPRGALVKALRAIAALAEDKARAAELPV